MAGVHLSYRCGHARVVPWSVHSFGSGGSKRLPVDGNLSCTGEAHGARKFGPSGSPSKLPDLCIV